MRRVSSAPEWCQVKRLMGKCVVGLGLFALLLSATLSLAAADEATSTSAADATLYATGKSSYRKRCARCHGVNMVNPGVGIFDLQDFPKADKARFVESVINGKNAMPSWGDVLDPKGIDALWVYVSTGPNRTPP